MFQSFSISYHHFSQTISTIQGENYLNILIMDDDFEEKLFDIRNSFGADLEIAKIILNLYEDKNLNVVKNFVKFMLFAYTKFHWKLEFQLIEYEKYIKKFNNYSYEIKSEINKYISLI